jgi:hypothetical protein
MRRELQHGTALHPDLIIGEQDWMARYPSRGVTRSANSEQLTHLIDVGFHTQVCLLGKP